jgi:hypothetical protein
MGERDVGGRGTPLAVVAGGVRCSFCGRPEARPIHGVPEVSVCEECLRSACKELLEELTGF